MRECDNGNVFGILGEDFKNFEKRWKEWLLEKMKNLNRKIITWTWENPDAQDAFAEWVGFPDERQSSEELGKIEALLELHPPLRVLDVGCGTGRHSLQMARRGYQVVAIDVAHNYLDEAKREAERLKLDIEFRLQRGSELREVENYDFILAYDHTLGFMSDEELAVHFGRIFTALRPSGKFLLALAGPKLIPGQESERTRTWSERNGKFILEEKYIEEGYRIEHCIVINTNMDEIKEFHERQRAFSLEDVMFLLLNAGFGQIDCLRDLDGKKTTPQEFGIFVCYK